MTSPLTEDRRTAIRNRLRLIEMKGWQHGEPIQFCETKNEAERQIRGARWKREVGGHADVIARFWYAKAPGRPLVVVVPR